VAGKNNKVGLTHETPHQKFPTTDLVRKKGVSVGGVKRMGDLNLIIRKGGLSQDICRTGEVG